MDYTAWSVIYGEQPSASKWNLLGSNDAAFYTALTEGWVAAGETWTYASATTFTVSTDQTAKYRTGVRIRLKQGGGYKYFIVVKSSYSNPTTTVTVQDAIDGSTYTVANAAITDNAYSMALMPKDFPLTANMDAFSRGSGWQSAQDETWTYASATTITVPTDATTRYQKGDKIRLKQGGTYKYFYVINVAATLLTITGGTDYTFTNAAVTDQYYSRATQPFGFPGGFNLATGRYLTLSGDQATLAVWDFIVGNGTSNATKVIAWSFTFAAIKTVDPTSIGRLVGSDPTAITQFNAQSSELASCLSTTTTGATIAFENVGGGTLNNTFRVGVGLVVIGTI